ncbi:MAG TPA: T9SS type A sorting domain-containing protein [Flavobacterium sp.]|jgi:hypothetical protein
MDKKLLLIPVVLFYGSVVTGQIINIPDPAFKLALTTTICSDFDGDIVVDGDVDTNDDGEIQLSEALAVTSLAVPGQNISDATGLNYFINLMVLDISTNSLSTLDITNLTHLTTLHCNNNQLTSLNFQNHETLYYVNCQYNLFTHLDLCGSGIISFWCGDNPLLTYVSVKNGINSPAWRHSQMIPPPLPYLMFWNLPNLTTVCYDPGELAAVQYGLSDGIEEDVTLVTDCTQNCELGNADFGQEDVSIFPNPATSSFSIYGIQNIDNIMIFNTHGQTVGKYKNTGGQDAINISALAAGVYFVEISTAGSKTIKRLIKSD